MGNEQLKEIDDDGNTLRHSQRITNLGYRLAKKLNFSEEKEYDFLEACLLHDIGKISTPASILMKPHDEFTDEDMEVVRKHPREGKEILEMQGRSPRVCNAVLLHHEFQKNLILRLEPSIGKLRISMSITQGCWPCLMYLTRLSSDAKISNRCRKKCVK